MPSIQMMNGDFTCSKLGVEALELLMPVKAVSNNS